MQKTLAPNSTPPATNNFDVRAGDIIRQSGIIVPPDLIQRLKTLIVSRLREVRKSGEVKERLLAHTLNGGMGFNNEVAEKLMLLIEADKKNEVAATVQKTEKPKQEVILEKPLVISSPSVTPSVPSTPSITPKVSLPPKPQTEISLPPTASKSVTPSIPVKPLPTKLTPRPVPSSADVRAAAPVLKITEEKFKPKMQEVTMPVAPKPPVTTAIPQTPSGRVKVEDVAYKPRLMGPIEELREMDLVEFRRLSPKPRVAADKIIVKVDLLAKEGYDKKIKGIEAWKKSSLNQLYNTLLSESLNKAKPIVQIIQEKIIAKQETLSEEEFKVIMDLNRVLKF